MEIVLTYEAQQQNDTEYNRNTQKLKKIIWHKTQQPKRLENLKHKLRILAERWWQKKLFINIKLPKLKFMVVNTHHFSSVYTNMLLGIE